MFSFVTLPSEELAAWVGSRKWEVYIYQHFSVFLMDKLVDHQISGVTHPDFPGASLASPK